MQYLKPFVLFLIFSIVSGSFLMAQQPDTLKNARHEQITVPLDKTDTAVQTQLHAGADSILQNALKPVPDNIPREKKHTPQGATRRSLILPGWGQAYNHEYWKVPLAAAAVGIPAYLFIDNNKEYQKARIAYNTVFEEMPISQGGKGKLDDAKFNQMDKKFKDLYNYCKERGGDYKRQYLSSVQSYRNTFRQYRDYSIVAVLLGWGLNVADATVFGHLRGFDVGPDLSMRVTPAYLKFANVPGITLNFTLK